MNPIKFKLRKLCSSVEEYEANANGPVDLDLLTRRLSDRPGVELFRHDNVITILFEDDGVTARLYPGGRVPIHAGLRENAERACRILEDVLSNGGVPKDRAERI